MDALRIEKATLAGCDWGARTANIVAALWPERCKATVSVSGYLIGSQEAGRMPLPPKAELEWWYQYYFATERGRAGYDKYRREFAKLIWQIASPKWEFDDATFDRSAAAFDNPDHVDIVIHNYRWRLGLAEGEPKYDELEKRLAEFPVITVPTITLEGDANGAPHPDPSAYAKKVLRAIRAPAHHRRHRTQPAAGSAAGRSPRPSATSHDLARGRRQARSQALGPDTRTRGTVGRQLGTHHGSDRKGAAYRREPAPPVAGIDGASRSSDGRLDVRLSSLGSARIGTNPEQLLAAGWSACFESAIALAAGKRKIASAGGIAIDAEVDLNVADPTATS